MTLLNNLLTTKQNAKDYEDYLASIYPIWRAALKSKDQAVINQIKADLSDVDPAKLDPENVAMLDSVTHLTYLIFPIFETEGGGITGTTLTNNQWPGAKALQKKIEPIWDKQPTTLADFPPQAFYRFANENYLDDDGFVTCLLDEDDLALYDFVLENNTPYYFDQDLQGQPKLTPCEPIQPLVAHLEQEDDPQQVTFTFDFNLE